MAGKKSLLPSVLILVLPLYGTATAFTIGHPVVNRSNSDGASSINFIDPSLSFGSVGIIDFWEIHGELSGNLALQVYRWVSGSTYLLIGENQVPADGSGYQSFLIDSSQRIEVQPGDIIGWRFESDHNGLIAFDYDPTVNVLWAWPVSNPSIGGTIDFPSGVWGDADNRIYSIAAHYTAVPGPTTLLLLGSGLVGLAGFRKRFGKN